MYLKAIQQEEDAKKKGRLKIFFGYAAVRIMKKRYDMDMEKTQHPKLLVDIPEVDIVITMGCNVNCPFLPCRYKEDWNLDDPTGKSDEEFGRVIDNIFANINELSTRISKMNI